MNIIGSSGKQIDRWAVAVIPAKAGIQSHKGGFPIKALGNDGKEECKQIHLKEQ